jgi:hypothetical protein
MYDSRGRRRYRTYDRRAPWRYATGSMDASGTDYRVGIGRFDGHRCAECSNSNRSE